MKLRQFIMILHISVQFTFCKRQFSNETKIIFDYLTSKTPGRALTWLEKLCDDFGPRHSGSLALERAIDWTVQTFKDDDASIKIHTEPVPGIPNFVRKKDEAWVLEPRIHELSVLAIDESFPAIVEADAVVVRDFGELQGINVTGKIVVMNMLWKGYGQTVVYRKAADRVAAKGAVGYLVASVTPKSIYSPHVGFGARGIRIPVGAITFEDAQMLWRWTQRGKRIKIKMNFQSKMQGTIISRNIVVEIKGTLKPDEIVIIGGHIDSWDISQGAIDNGGGVASCKYALLALAKLAKIYPEMAPKRTIRAVFWVAEEQGYFGSQQYFKDHKDEKIVYAGENDIGAFRPMDYKSAMLYSGNGKARKLLELAMENLNAIGIPLSIEDAKIVGGDVRLFSKNGVPSTFYVSDRVDTTYFPLHHSKGDFVSVFTPEDIDYVAAIFAVTAFHFAQSELSFKDLIDKGADSSLSSNGFFIPLNSTL